MTCPKHGWSFDIFTGLGDRGNYRLNIWEVELRDLAQSRAASSGTNPNKDTTEASMEINKAPSNFLVSQAKEVWVRRKPRIG